MSEQHDVETQQQESSSNHQHVAVVESSSEQPLQSVQENSAPSSTASVPMLHQASTISNPIHYTTDLLVQQYSHLLLNSIHEGDQSQIIKQIDTIIEALLKRCDELGEQLDFIHSTYYSMIQQQEPSLETAATTMESNSNETQKIDAVSGTTTTTLHHLLSMMIHVKEMYQRIDNLLQYVTHVKEKVNSLDTKLNEFEKHKNSVSGSTAKVSRVVSSLFGGIFSKGGSSARDHESSSHESHQQTPPISFNKEDYLLL
ncbi:hypothetical protein C9374_009282 [Naegleria lovaniensis]|uniref:Uncharacterized protein n=1 Tax=Naegleria lovaniensis TaxID=51637 RepID=A0AA88GHP7_NAELO|nr:uncharacterized protein C9374_009282 [Naegleria lovaniensis]KAG2377371.1 hypothetical protein C9374_009282 [Naegleria lovaniensis]